jgi:DNA-binding transcriptional ArsR family regulator
MTSSGENNWLQGAGALTQSLIASLHLRFIADEMLEQLPAASRVGKTIVGGIDLNKARMRRVIEALLALSSSPNGFTASDVAARVRALSKQTSQYGPRHAAYDLKKLRGKHIIRRIDHTRRYEPLLTGLRAMTALLVLRDKAIKPLLAAALPLRPKRGAQPKTDRSTLRCHPSRHERRLP